MRIKKIVVRNSLKNTNPQQTFSLFHLPQEEKCGENEANTRGIFLFKLNILKKILSRAINCGKEINMRILMENFSTAK